MGVLHLGAGVASEGALPLRGGARRRPKVVPDHHQHITRTAEAVAGTFPERAAFATPRILVSSAMCATNLPPKEAYAGPMPGLHGRDWVGGSPGGAVIEPATVASIVCGDAEGHALHLCGKRIDPRDRSPDRVASGVNARSVLLNNYLSKRVDGWSDEDAVMSVIEASRGRQATLAEMQHAAEEKLAAVTDEVEIRLASSASCSGRSRADGPRLRDATTPCGRQPYRRGIAWPSRFEGTGPSVVEEEIAKVREACGAREARSAGSDQRRRGLVRAEIYRESATLVGTQLASITLAGVVPTAGGSGPREADTSRVGSRGASGVAAQPAALRHAVCFARPGWIKKAGWVEIRAPFDRIDLATGVDVHGCLHAATHRFHFIAARTYPAINGRLSAATRLSSRAPSSC